MASIVFVQTEWFEHLGIISLAAAARADGHQVGLIVSRNGVKTAARLVDAAPDVAAFSATTGAHRTVLNMIRSLRPFFRGLIILGGPHATFFPEVIQDPGVDAICRGEGEIPLLQLLNRLDRGYDLEDLSGFWFKKNGEIRKNPPGPIVRDLDSLPFPARDLLEQSAPLFRHASMRRVMAGRGCPYRCTYCFNEAMREFSRGQGPYVRLRSVDHMLSELKTIARHGRPTINFVDDTFGLNREWALEFLERYRREIALPFIVNLRPDQVDSELTLALAEAGCYCVQMGVETASHELRRQVLARQVSDEELEAAARRIKDSGIKLLTYNMVGLPGENLSDAAKTLDWNACMKVDFPRFSIFQPYPRTILGDKTLALLHGNLAQKYANPDLISESYFRRSPLKGNEPRKIENLHKLFLLYLQFPRFRKTILSLTKLPANPIYDFIFLASIGLQYQKATNHGLIETLKIGLRNLRAYFA